MTAPQTSLRFNATIYADDKVALVEALKYVISQIEADPWGEAELDSEALTSTITGLSYIRDLSEEEE